MKRLRKTSNIVLNERNNNVRKFSIKHFIVAFAVSWLVTDLAYGSPHPFVDTSCAGAKFYLNGQYVAETSRFDIPVPITDLYAGLRVYGQPIGAISESLCLFDPVDRSDVWWVETYDIDTYDETHGVLSIIVPPVFGDGFE